MMYRMIIITLCFLIKVSSFVAAADSLWTIKCREDICWTKINQSGNLLLTDKMDFYLVDSNTGDIIFKKENIYAVDSILWRPNIPVLTIFSRKGFSTTVSFIDIENGKEILKSDPLEGRMISFKYPDSTGKGCFILQDQEMKNIFLTTYDLKTGEIKTFQDFVPDKGIKKSFVHGAKYGLVTFPIDVAACMTIEDRAAYFVYNKPWKLDLETGQIDWFCNKSFSQDYYNGNNCIYIISSKSLYAIDKIHGSTKWISSYNDESFSIYKYDPADEGIIYIKGRDFINAVRLSDGTLLWEEPIKFSNEPDKFFVKENIIYLVADQRISAFDRNSGMLKWIFPNDSKRFSIALFGENNVYVVGEDYLSNISLIDCNLIWEAPFIFNGSPQRLFYLESQLALLAGDSLFLVAEENGKEICRTSLDSFKEYISRMEIRESGLSVMGTQEVCLIDTSSGEIKWNLSLEQFEIHESFWAGLGKAALEGAIVGALSGFAGSGVRAGAYEKLENTDFFGSSGKRYSLKSAGMNHMYIMTKVKEECGVVAVNLDTGNVDGEVIVDVKNANFFVHPPLSRIFQISGKELKASSF
ncbi:MAG TPA: PQQ-binding-like beta-propeller repeat protein [archaeon]|nr:PQQ-binding-like beta-propeller repeat protein [archaeon]